MHSNSKKSFVLNRETLRYLQADEADQVNGGLSRGVSFTIAVKGLCGTGLSDDGNCANNRPE